MKEIESGAFNRCEKLKQIWVYAEVPFKLAASSFSDDIYLDAVLYVPFGTKATYSSKRGWENFYSIQEFDATGIHQAHFSNEETVVGYYHINGIQKKTQFKGLNLIKYTNGRIKKTFVK